MSFQHCMEEMTQPQLYIWYAETIKREHREKVNEEKSAWGRTANILAMLQNTAMGNKKKAKPDEFMPDFIENFEDMFEQAEEESNETYIELAEEAGLNTPSDY